MSSRGNLRERLVYACDDYPLYGPVLQLNLLAVLRIILHVACLLCVCR